MIPLVVFSLPTFFYCQNIDADVLATGFFGKCVITYSMKCIGGENTTNENNSQTSYLFHYIHYKYISYEINFLFFFSFKFAFY